MPTVRSINPGTALYQSSKIDCACLNSFGPDMIPGSISINSYKQFCLHVDLYIVHDCCNDLDGTLCLRASIDSSCDVFDRSAKPVKNLL